MAALGGIYWRSQEIAFGYFKPHEYGRYARAYFADRSIPTEDFIGKLRPVSRRFMPHRFSLRHGASSGLVLQLEKRRRRSNAVKGCIAAAVVAPLLGLGVISGRRGHELKAQISSCRAEVKLSEGRANSDIARLDRLDKQLAEFRRANDVQDFNSLVDPYNALLGRVRQEASQYEAARKACNALIDKFNRNQ